MTTKAKGPHRKPETWSKLVDEKWGGEAPVLSPEASVKAAKRLYRKAMGQPWRGGTRITSGNRRTWVRNGVLVVNPNQQEFNGHGGLREIIHMMSHLCHRRLHPRDAPHSRRQAVLEGKLVTYAINSGWLKPGALEPRPKQVAQESSAPVKPDKVQQRYARMCRNEAKWASNLEQAQRLHKKWSKEKRDYEARHGERLVAP